ncbi:hypothetical protein DSL72_000230 [Monilinia vaccinii-corymbosi]|uniref:Uncharacterized protein n=1 Tax=Monilinia vaccinii-corymbosi TaxID=61207 RepID=A0A8A3P134_9HELO|nr:hypothetical protein DSL72_000230 [Monilinia vaccinii-corymbosi]
MFVSITRQTPKLRQPYVCTSCLSKLLGASNALPLYSNAILSRGPRNAATFSTTRCDYTSVKEKKAVAKNPKRPKIEAPKKNASGNDQKAGDDASGDGGEANTVGKTLSDVESLTKLINKGKKGKEEKEGEEEKEEKEEKKGKKGKKEKTEKKDKKERKGRKGKGAQRDILKADETTVEDGTVENWELKVSKVMAKAKKMATETARNNAKKKKKRGDAKSKVENEEEMESAVRIMKVKQELINYVNSSGLPTVQRLSAVGEETDQKKIAPSQLHAIYQSMVAQNGEAAARKDLVDLIQKGGLTTTDRTQFMKELRASLVNRPKPKGKGKSSAKTASSSDDSAGMLAALESVRIRKFVTSKGKQPKTPAKTPASPRGPKQFKTGPITKSPGTTEFEVKSVDASSLQLQPISKKQPPVPGLSYGLERALFNPGVYHLQDPRSRVFNFDPYLQQIMPVNEFDFTALKQYITSSRDKALIETAKGEKRKYTGSTSSMSASLAHFHFLLSQWRPINTSMLSQGFPIEFNSFTALQRGPSAIFLRERDGVYAIDADKQFDTANILSMLGKSMEKLLTLPKEEFEQYRKENSDSITEDQRNEAESYHYTAMGDFLMRSQLDAYDPRLPGTGMFDLKTRAVVSIRMDIDNYAEGSGYEIFSRHGEFESFEREYHDMIRAAFLKYSLQVRMGRMDGIFVAYHNVERIFGFQYISLPELDNTLHGTTDTTLGDSEFKLSVDLLNKVLDRATARFPGRSLRLYFETRGNVDTPFMYIFAEPMEEEDIQRIQDTNKAEIEAFEARVLGLHGGKVTAEEQTEEKKDAEWADLRLKIEESMEHDEYAMKSAKEIAESLLEHNDVTGLTLDEVEQRVEEFLSTSSYNENVEDDNVGEDDNGVWKEEENIDADEDMEKTTANVDEDADEEDDEGEDEDDDEGEEEDEEEEEEEDEEEEEEEEEDEEEDEEDEEEEEEEEEEEDEQEDEAEEEDDDVDEEAGERDAENETEDSNDDAKTSDLTVIATEEAVIQEGLLVDPAEETSEVERNDYESLEAEIQEPELVENEDLLIDSAEETSSINDTSDETLNSEESTADESEASGEVDENTQTTSMTDIESNPPEEEKAPEILAMHLAIRNKVNGVYTVRPENLKATDNWTVEYALSEIPQPEKAVNLYQACQKRRKMALSRSDEPGGNKWAEDRNNKFILNLKSLAMKGRLWRQETTQKEAGLPIKTLDFKGEAKEVGVYEGYEEIKGDAEEKTSEDKKE